MTIVFLEKLTVTHPFKKLSSSYGTRRFITVFTRPRHWPFYWALCIPFTFSDPISLRFIPILSFLLYLALLSGLFPSDFPTKILYAFLISAIQAIWHIHLIILGLIRYKEDVCLSGQMVAFEGIQIYFVFQYLENLSGESLGRPWTRWKYNVAVCY